MATGANVLSMLLPNGGWVITGDDFDSIIYDKGVSPLTKKQFTDGFNEYDTFQANMKAEKIAAKAAVLDRLGITADEAKLLLS